MKQKMRRNRKNCINKKIGNFICYWEKQVNCYQRTQGLILEFIFLSMPLPIKSTKRKRKDRIKKKMFYFSSNFESVFRWFTLYVNRSSVHAIDFNVIFSIFLTMWARHPQSLHKFEMKIKFNWKQITLNFLSIQKFYLLSIIKSNCDCWFLFY